jgi:hypothetical protein
MSKCLSFKQVVCVCWHWLQVDPFDQNSPIKQAAIEKFPPDMFFVLRVVQLLRGMANGAWRSDDDQGVDGGR